MLKQYSDDTAILGQYWDDVAIIRSEYMIYIGLIHESIFDKYGIGLYLEYLADVYRLFTGRK